MAWTDSLGLDAEDLFRQRAFLMDRAALYEENKDSSARGRLMAATLWRDAAALSLILANYQEARKLLHRASAAYLDEGILYGFTLAAIAGDRQTWRSRRDKLEPLRDYLIHLQIVNEQRVPQDLPMAFVPPEDVVWALQSLALISPLAKEWSSEDGDEIGLRFQLASVIDKRMASFDRAGPSLIYLTALTDLSLMKGSTSYDFGTLQPRLNALAAEREAEIQAARKDQFHWRMMPNPADVINLDLTILALALLDHGQDEILELAFPALNEVTALPILVARALRTQIP